jgi:histidinol-phosphate aminotransferase
MNYWNTTLKGMTEYMPGEQPDNIDEFVKLNTNENPFPPSQKVITAIREEAGDSLRRYPNPNAQKVRETFAEQNGLTPENIFVANGSDEIFTLLFRGFIEKEGLAAFCYPSYALYYTMAEANGIKYEKINFDQDFNVPFDKLLKKKYDMVILCNPNNPTGTGVPLNGIKTFLAKYKGLLVVDEAYVDFYNESAINLIKDYDNLIVTRSFSKSYSLAGLRVGIAVAQDKIIEGFLKLKDSYNVDRLAAAGALAALLDQKAFKYSVEMVKNNKDYMESRLESLGFEIVPSKANFLFVRHPDILSKDLYETLKAKKILIRHHKGPIQENYVRITVGSMMEIKSLVKAIEEILENKGSSENF